MAVNTAFKPEIEEKSGTIPMKTSESAFAVANVHKRVTKPSPRPFNNKNKKIMRKSGNSNRPAPPSGGGFQPAVLIGAEIAFAALLLYFTNTPIDLNTTAQVQRSPMITIELPSASVAVASTTTADMNNALLNNKN